MTEIAKLVERLKHEGWGPLGKPWATEAADALTSLAAENSDLLAKADADAFIISNLAAENETLRVKTLAWMPIETAPKGRALYGYHSPVLCSWWAHIFNAPEEPTRYGYTHWQHLPEPPARALHTELTSEPSP